MSTISELIPIMQEEYPNLYILDEDMFKGDPALTYTADDFMFAYWVEDETSFMFFEEYENDEKFTIQTDLIEEPSEFYQLFVNFINWIDENIFLTEETQDIIATEFFKPLKKYGHKPEKDWSIDDYL